MPSVLTAAAALINADFLRRRRRNGKMTFVLHIACEARIRWIDRKRERGRKEEGANATSECYRVRFTCTPLQPDGRLSLMKRILKFELSRKRIAKGDTTQCDPAALVTKG